MKQRNTIHIILTIIACAALAACGAADRITQIGKTPEMTKIANPVTQPEYQPVSLPMPAPKKVSTEKNSLWASNRQTSSRISAPLMSVTS